MMRSYCDEHGERILEMYCSECGEIICLLCHALKHSGHNCMHVDEVAEIYRQQMEQDICMVASVIDSDNGIVDDIGQELKQLEVSLTKAKADIAEHVEALKTDIDCKANELSAKDDLLAQIQKQQIAETRADVQKSVALKQGFCNYLKQMHTNGTSVDLARDAEKLHARAEETQPTVRERSPSCFIQYNPKRRFPFFRNVDSMGTVALIQLEEDNEKNKLIRQEETKGRSLPSVTY